MPGEDNAVKIARLEEQIGAMRDLLDRMSDKLDALEAAMNRGRGVFAASLTFAGLVGATATAVVQFFTRSNP
jgi:hypothetical protein